MEPITLLTLVNACLLGIVGFFLRRLVVNTDETNKQNDIRLKDVEKGLSSGVVLKSECKEHIMSCGVKVAVESINLLLKEMFDKQTQFRIDVPKQYISKTEYNEDIKELKLWVRELSEKIDRLLLRP